MVKEQEFWNSEAEKNADFAVWGTGTDNETKKCLDMVNKNLAGAKKIVDFGCGIGRIIFPLAAMNEGTFYGYDFSQSMIKEAHLRKYNRGIDNVHFSDDWDVIPEVDFVYSVVTFQHNNYEDLAISFQRIWDKLNKGGYFQFQFVEGDHHSFLNHKYKYENIVNMLNQIGFDILETEKGIYPEWIWILAKKL